jgi:hypothetical protein
MFSSSLVNFIMEVWCGMACGLAWRDHLHYQKFQN